MAWRKKEVKKTVDKSEIHIWYKCILIREAVNESIFVK